MISEVKRIKLAKSRAIMFLYDRKNTTTRKRRDLRKRKS